MANDKYLSKEGLSYFWAKLKSTLTSIGNRITAIEAKESDWDAKAEIKDIPTNTSDLTNDSEFITRGVSNLAYYTLSSNLASVATSNDYNDLSNKPYIEQGNQSSLNFVGLPQGRYICSYSGNTTGSPVMASEGICITVINYSTSFGCQYCFTDGDNIIYFRKYINGNWDNWKTPEDVSNKVTSISSSSTDDQYPSAKTVYKETYNLDTRIVSLNNITEKSINKTPLIDNSSTDNQYPTAKAVLDFVTGKENKLKIGSTTTAQWKNTTDSSAQWYFYEGASTSTYDLPYSNCVILVFKHSGARGYALAFSWPNGTANVWHNNLHDSWRGWKQLH